MEYHIGDFSVDSLGQPVLDESTLSSVVWQSGYFHTYFPWTIESETVWFRGVISDSVYLKFPPHYGAIEVYNENVQVFESSPKTRYWLSKKAIFGTDIKLQSNPSGNRIFVKLSREGLEPLGFKSITVRDLSLEYVSENLLNSRLISGLVLVCLSFLLAIVYFKRRVDRPLFLFGAGLFAIALGNYFLFTEPAGMIFIHSFELSYYLQMMGLYLFPVGLLLLCNEFSAMRNRSHLKYMWKIHMLITVIVLGLDLFGIISLAALTVFLVAVIFLEFGVLVSGAVLLWKQKPEEGRDFHIALTVLMVFGVLNVFESLEITTTGIAFFPIGSLVFIGFLALILEENISRNHQKLMRYSSVLETKSKELEAHSRNLEKDVEKRTIDVLNKNVALGKAMDQLQEAQQQLIMQEKMASLGNLVAGVAHEINNPVGAVTSSVHTLSLAIEELEKIFEVNNIEITPEINKILSICKTNNHVSIEATKRITQIVKTLKNFARLDESEYKKVDIREGVESTLALVQYELKDRVTVEKDFQDIPETFCFPNEMNQVFMNLIINAFQAIKGKGTIYITTRTVNGNIEVAIKDSGVGIEESEIGKVFDPGFTTKGVGVGTGLGLSISYNIVTKHQGRLNVVSKLGEGSIFTVIIPVKAEMKS